MKVLMLHNRYLLPGGEEQSTEADVALLREHGHQVELMERDNRDIGRLGRVRTAMGTIWSGDSRNTVETRLGAAKFDILHVQNFFPLWSPSVYYAASRRGVPVVQTLHNYRLMCVNSFFYRDQRPCEDCLGRAIPWPGIVHRCYRDSRAGSAVVAAMIGLHRLAGTWERKVDRYVAVSESAREKYIAGGLPADKIAVRSNFLHPSPEPGSGGGGYALFAGRLSREKGVATMLEAWRAADHPLPLRIAGDGPLREMVLEAGHANPLVEYLGPKALPEVLSLMGAAEFLVFPSEWHETMGRTIMESFAVGTPVVASGAGAPASMVKEGTTGFHFVAGDAQSMRQRVEWCSRSLPELRSMRKHARAAFEERYTGAAAMASLVGIYRAAQETARLREQP